nr:hypothetical protein [Tanacetum cinerariifolium]
MVAGWLVRVAVVKWGRMGGAWRCVGGDGSGGCGMEMMAAIVVTCGGAFGGGAARDGEWHRGSNRSGDKERFLGSSEKFFGGDGGGRQWPAGGWLAGNNRERGPSVFSCYKK